MRRLRKEILPHGKRQSNQNFPAQSFHTDASGWPGPPHCGDRVSRRTTVSRVRRMYVKRNTDVDGAWTSVKGGRDRGSYIYEKATPIPFLVNPNAMCSSQILLAASMFSPLSNREGLEAGRCTTPLPIAPEQKCPVASIKKLASPRPNKNPPPKPTANKQSYSPSLVQFSYQQKPPRFTLNSFSIIRLTLVAATVAGIPLCVMHARSTEMTLLYFSVLRLIFVRFPEELSFAWLGILTFVQKACILARALHPRSCPVPL